MVMVEEERVLCAPWELSTDKNLWNLNMLRSVDSKVKINRLQG